jgi:hypothetical protein
MRACVWLPALISGLAFMTSLPAAQSQTFGGFDCTIDCSGHSAGYKWAERKGITDEDECPYGNSQSFREGCIAYTQDQNMDPDRDDDGSMVGHRGRRSMSPADDEDE